jgi:hypothetical protein
MYTLKAAEFKPEHFGWEVKDRVATITLNRPERKNPLTFDSYAELPALAVIFVPVGTYTKLSAR